MEFMTEPTRSAQRREHPELIGQTWRRVRRSFQRDLWFQHFGRRFRDRGATNLGTVAACWNCKKSAAPSFLRLRRWPAVCHWQRPDVVFGNDRMVAIDSSPRELCAVLFSNIASSALQMGTNCETQMPESSDAGVS